MCPFCISHSPINSPLLEIPCFHQRPMWGSLRSASHHHPSASTSHQTDGFLSKGLGLSTQRWGMLAQYRDQYSCFWSFFPLQWACSRESQAIAESDCLCMGFGGDEETCVIGELFLWIGNTLGFECKRAWSVNSEPSPPREILLILQDPT